MSVNQGNPFRSWPKVELHRHLPGAIRFETWWDIVNEYHVKLPTRDPDELRQRMTITGQTSLKAFLTCFDMINLCFVNVAALERVTYEVIEDAVAENIVYLELRFSPTRMAIAANIPTADALEAVIEGRHRAVVDFPIEVGLIPGLSRELGVKTCAAEADVITHYAQRGIEGIDLLGNEADFPADWFASIFAPIARKGQLGITIHAGEAAGADSIQSAILKLGATRIGHGISAQDDPGVMELIKERGVVLEVCPTSNVQTGAVSDLASHPLVRYLRNGIRVTINTDNPRVSRIDLANEYEAATSILGLSDKEIAETLDYAVDGAFAGEEVKGRIRDRLMTANSKE